MKNRYLAIMIVALVSTLIIPYSATDSAAYDQGDPYILFWIDGEYYAEVDVADLSEDTIPDAPYKEGYKFICWKDAWNNPVYDLLSYEYHEGRNLLWAYFEQESITAPEDGDRDLKLAIVLISMMILIILFAIVIMRCM